MFHARLEALREQLLHAGIAPRHVRRYIAELGDHFDDLVREETANGLNRENAEISAHERIGSNDQLYAVMLAKPQLRSIAARFPWLVFGLGSVVMLPLIVVIAVLVDAGLLSLAERSTTPDWVRIVIATWNGFIIYVAPVVIALSLCALGIRQRMPFSWMVLSATTICILGAFHEVDLAWSDLAGQSSIGVGFAWAPPFPPDMIFLGMIRVGANLTVVTVLCYSWLRVRVAYQDLSARAG